VVLVVFALTV
jgi:hypothetical protein